MSDSPYNDDALKGEGDPVATGPKGGGEWPGKDEPDPRAAGADPVERERIEAERGRVRPGLDPEMKEALDGDDEVSASGAAPPPEVK